jgi:hypothetical protein
LFFLVFLLFSLFFLHFLFFFFDLFVLYVFFQLFKVFSVVFFSEKGMIFRALKCYWGTNWSCLQYHDQNGQTRLKIGFNLGLKKAIYVRSSAEVEVGSFFCSSNI